MTHHGRHWQLDGHRHSIPRPLQQPRPPILVGSQVPAGHRARSPHRGRLAGGASAPPWTSSPRRRCASPRAPAAAGAAARARISAVCSRWSCGPDEDTAIRRARAYLLEKYAAYLSWGIRRHHASSPPRRPKRSCAAWPPIAFAVGSPRAGDRRPCSPSIKAGVTHATMRVSWPGMPQSEVLAGIERLGRDVSRESGAGRQPAAMTALPASTSPAGCNSAACWRRAAARSGPAPVAANPK